MKKRLLSIMLLVTFLFTTCHQYFLIDTHASTYDDGETPFCNSDVEAYSDEWCYYVDVDNGTGIYRESYEKENRELIFNEPTKEIALCNNLLYVSYSDKNEIGVIDLVKNEITHIITSESRIHRFAVSEDKIYYLCDETIFCCPKLGGDTVVILQVDGLSRFWFTDENVFEYILDDESNIYQYDVINEKTIYSYQNNITNLETTSEYKSATRGISLASLKTKFPHGKYWNHVGGSNNPDGYTSTPCTCHGSCNYYGYCNCNSFSNAIQCHGFALKVGYDYYGSDPRNWSKVYNLNSLKAGDVIRYKNDRHSIWVTAVNGDTITYADCNSTGRCQIRWGATISKSTVSATLTYVYVAPYTATSTACTTHTKGTYLWYEAAHPHYNYWTCSACGATFTDGSTEFVESCTECVNNSIERHSVMDAWFSTEKMGEGTTVEYKGNSIYFCYKLYDTNTGDLFDSYRSDFDYTVKETVYNPDGSVLFSYTYTNDNNWIMFTPTENGIYKAEVTYTPSGGNPTTVHRSFTSTNVISKDIWVSETPMGEEVSVLLTNREYYLNYKMYDSDTGELFNVWNVVLDSYGMKLEVKAPSSTVEKTFSNEDTGSLAFTVNEEGSYILNLYGINGSSPMESITLQARNDYIFSVYYDANGGSGAPAVQTKRYGTALTLSEKVPEKFGYNFSGWAKSSSATKADCQPGDSYTANNNVTFYAVWQKAKNITDVYYSAKITYPGVGYYYMLKPDKTTSYYIGVSGYANSRDADSRLTLYNSEMSQINVGAADEGTGRSEMFWNLNSGETYYLYVELIESTVTGGVDLLVFPGSEISYDANGGSGAPTSEYCYDSAINLSEIKPTRLGYTFLGWAESRSATEATYQSGDRYYTSDDVTLYAVWKLGCSDNHSYRYEVTATPTTSTAGVLTGTCSRCSGTTTVTLPKLNTTDYTYSVVKAATCTATGTGRYTWKTTTYGSYYFDVTIAKTSHNYTTKVTAPTCTAQGYTTHTCTACGNSYKDTYTAALGHNYSYKVTTAPTTSATGTLKGTCSRCSGTTTVTLPKLNTTDYNYSVVKAATCTATGTGRYTWKTTSYGSFYFDVTIAKTSHNYTTKVTAPTCTEQGYTTHTCTACGDSYKDTYTAALGHSYSYKVTTTPTTSAAGVLTGTCSRCSGTTIVTLPKLNTTDYTYSVVKAATCTETGTGRYTWNTTTYGSFYFDVTTAKTGHSYTEKVTAPTCTEQGYTTHTCTVCGDSYKDTYTAALGHSYSYKVTTTPTTSAAGVLTGTCSRCSGTTTVTLPKLNTTDYTYSVVKAATCTATGTGRYTWKTTTYGSYYFDVTIAKTSHNYTTKVTAPTCTAQGYTTHTCTVCGDSYNDSFTAALGHSESAWIIDRNATCTASGSKHTECVHCGVVMQTAVIPANGHTMSAWIVDRNATCTVSGTKHTECTVCGATLETAAIPATGHSYADSVTAPTCTEKGYTMHTCAFCGDSYRDTITAELGHAWDNGTVTTQPTETKEGVKTFTCTRCGATKTESIPVLGHEHQYTAKVTAPTCTEQGYTTHTCTTCGDSYVDSYVAALGHAWDNGTVTTQPTETKEGVKTFTCTRCGATKTEPIARLTDCDGGNNCPSHGFTDVPMPPHWMHAGIDFVVENNLFLGTSDTTFSPNESMTRAMLVTVLWRLEGKPEAGTQTGFKDVPAGEYYAQPVAWAAANGIVMGTSDTTFSPNGKITREQMATILYRYAQQKGYDTSKSADLSKFPDNGKVSSYARQALAWANAEGLINGDEQSNGTVLLDPAGNATRAQVAAILMRYVQNVVE